MNDELNRLRAELVTVTFEGKVIQADAMLKEADAKAEPSQRKMTLLEQERNDFMTQVFLLVGVCLSPKANYYMRCA